jgi:hypothetical protein
MTLTISPLSGSRHSRFGLFFSALHTPLWPGADGRADGVNSRWRAFATTNERRDLAPAIPEFYRVAVHKLSGPRLCAIVPAG